jgi:hypothetical protein
MKITLALFLTIVLCSCKQTKDTTKIFILDSNLQDTTKSIVQLVSDKHFSQFKTPIEVYYFLNDKLVDSIIDSDFGMISWYSNNKDTIDLVAHIGEFETSALLIRFISGKPQVFHYRAPHEEQNYFRLNKFDIFTSQVKVPPTRYKLSISQIPDTIKKPVVFGQIEMESSGYYDRRVTLQQKHSIQMKFNFRSQYRKFDY